MPRARRHLVGAALATACTVVLAGLAMPACAANAAADLPALDVKAIVDQSIYVSGEPIIVTVTVKNVGTATANNVREVSHAAPPAAAVPGLDADDEGVTGIIWSEAPADGFDTGFDLPAGQTRTLTRNGVVDDWAAEHGQASIAWTFKPSGELAITANANPSVFLKVPVPGAMGNLAGVVCEGAQFEVVVCQYVSPGGPPKGVPGVKVILLEPGTDAPMAETTTDASGAFSFADVQVGTRFLRFEAPAGWHMISGPRYQALVVSGADPNNSKLFAAARRNGSPGETVPPPPTEEPEPEASGTPSAANAAQDGTGGSDRPGAAWSIAGFVTGSGNGGLLPTGVGALLVLLGVAGYLANRRRRVRARAARH